MGHHPLADTAARRELLLDSVDVIGGNLPATLKLDVHALLMEQFEATDAVKRFAAANERIAAALEKLAGLGLVQHQQPELPLRGEGVVVPRGQT